MYIFIYFYALNTHTHTLNQERGLDNIGVMDSDWQDKGPDSCRDRSGTLQVAHTHVKRA